MFVQEEKIFAGKVLKMHICTVDGTEWMEEVTDDTTVEKLKEKCLKHVGLRGFCLCLRCLSFCPVIPLPGLFAADRALRVDCHCQCQCQCQWLRIYSNWVDFAIYN